MALQFFAVHSEALATTHDALQRHASRQGLRPPGPTRALRIAQLYGHLQLRAAGRSSLVIAVSELAGSWRFQPRQLRQDLALLQALGWLSATGTSRGTVIRLIGPVTAEPSVSAAAATPCLPAKATPVPHASGLSKPVVPPAPVHDDSRQLLQRLAGLYNQHRPDSWPAYQPRGHGLRPKLRQALRQAGSADALAATLTAALQGMPPFWRHTYPQGRSGAECMAVLFCTDRGCAGLGVEFWHLFSWAQATSMPPPDIAGAGDHPSAGAGVAAVPLLPQAPGEESSAGLLARAQALFAWDGHHWRGQGIAAAELSRTEKLRHVLALEATGIGEAGAAMRQYGSGDEAAWS